MTSSGLGLVVEICIDPATSSYSGVATRIYHGFHRHLLPLQGVDMNPIYSRSLISISNHLDLDILDVISLLVSS